MPWMGSMERRKMAKSCEAKVPRDEQKSLRAAYALGMHGAKRPATPGPKKERPASKGRVRKGRTRN
jgi:hypothetical protein